MRLRTLLAAVLVVFVAGCAMLTTARISTGELIEQVGEDFLSKATLVDKLRGDGTLTLEEYREFWIWAENDFKPVFDVAYKAWKSGENVEGFRNQIEEFRQALLVWAIKLSRSQP